MIKDGDKIKLTLFGKEHDFKVCFYGENGDEGSVLGKREEDLLKWFTEKVHVEDYAEQIVTHYNENAEEYEYDPITKDDLFNSGVVDLYNIIINTKTTCGIADDIPDIAISGDADCDYDSGISICFRDKKFLRIDTESDIL